MKKYNAELINETNCMFDSLESNNIAEIKKWAQSRDDTYHLIIYHNDLNNAGCSVRHDLYKIVSDKLTHVETFIN